MTVNLRVEILSPSKEFLLSRLSRMNEFRKSISVFISRRTSWKAVRHNSRLFILCYLFFIFIGCKEEQWVNTSCSQWAAASTADCSTYKYTDSSQRWEICWATGSWLLLTLVQMSVYISWWLHFWQALSQSTLRDFIPHCCLGTSTFNSTFRQQGELLRLKTALSLGG